MISRELLKQKKYNLKVQPLRILSNEGILLHTRMINDHNIIGSTGIAFRAEGCKQERMKIGCVREMRGYFIRQIMEINAGQGLRKLATAALCPQP
jgi:hypothetical protein